MVALESQGEPVGTVEIMMTSAKKELTSMNQGPFCWKTDGNSASVCLRAICHVFLEPQT